MPDLKKNLKSDCLFCKILQKQIPAEVVFEDEKILVFKDINPKVKTHWLVIPKYHIESLLEVDESDSDFLSHALIKLKHLAVKAGVRGFRTVINSGKDGGQEVFHLHLHFLAGEDLSAF